MVDLFELPVEDLICLPVVDLVELPIADLICLPVVDLICLPVVDLVVDVLSSLAAVAESTDPLALAENRKTILKGTVSQELRWVLLYINQKLFSRPIIKF